MALIHCNYFSYVLGLSCSMYVILPQHSNGQTKAPCEKHPVLYLLHGYSDDHTIWLRRTSIERYVSEMDLAVIMPEVHLSYYTDMAIGGKYYTFLTEELPSIARSFFHLSAAREDNFAAGLSMGGYGALKLALGRPDMYAAGASLSGAVDIEEIVEMRPRNAFDAVFGDVNKIPGSENDLFHLARTLGDSEGIKPKLFQCCGTEDFLYNQNIRFRDFIKKFPYDYTYEEEPGGHSWDYWDKKIQRVLEWLPLRK